MTKFPSGNIRMGIGFQTDY